MNCTLITHLIPASSHPEAAALGKRFQSRLRASDSSSSHRAPLVSVVPSSVSSRRRSIGWSLQTSGWRISSTLWCLFSWTWSISSASTSLSCSGATARGCYLSLKVGPGRILIILFLAVLDFFRAIFHAFFLQKRIVFCVLLDCRPLPINLFRVVSPVQNSVCHMWAYTNPRRRSVPCFHSIKLDFLSHRRLKL